MMAFTNPHLSFSRISRFEQCPLSFRLAYIDRLPVSQPLPEPLRFGKVVHAALEHFYRDLIEQKHDGPLPEAKLLFCFGEAWKREGLQGLNLFTEGALMLGDYARRQHHVVAANVLAVEQEFRLQAGPFTVLGYIDRVDRLDDETIEVIDYKTNRQLFSREEVDTSLQLSIYAAAVKRLCTWAKKVKLTFLMLCWCRCVSRRREEQLADALAYGRHARSPDRDGHRLPVPPLAELQLLRPPAPLPGVRGRAQGEARVHLRQPRRPRRGGEGARGGRPALEGALRPEVGLEGHHPTHLKHQDELVLGGVRYRMFATTSVDYPLEPTLDVLTVATGRSREELLQQLGSVDKKALDAELKRISKAVGTSRASMLKAELEAHADKTHSPRFWAKEVA